MIAGNRPKRFRCRGYRSWTAIICACLVFGLAPVSVDAFDIVLGTGEVESFSHFAGRIVCRVINRHAPDLRCQVQPAAGEMDNLTNLQGGSLDIGLVDSRMLHDAVQKGGYFEFLDIRYDHLRALLPLYDTPFALVVRGDAAIASLEGLKGKRINAGAPRSPRHLAVETIMKAKGWSADDFSLFAELPSSHSQDTMAFCHGKVQAMVTVGVHPEPSVEQLFELCKAEIVDLYDDDIDKLVRDHPAFSTFDIAAGTYPRQSDTVRTFGTRVLLVASDSLDDQTVFQIMEAIDSLQDRLKAAHPALAAYTSGGSWEEDVVIPLHAGAVKYLSER